MSHFTEDVMKFGPAPTLAREIPVAVANLLVSALALAIVYAVGGGADTMFVVLAVVLVAYGLGRPLYVALRGNRPAHG
ncbi:hypothetical protein [Rhodococcoides corynebacterioides]|uniref:Uncharacterized protein n=1 Tax=Rhodococcoides corynebacterioides TaxID=53972 RepID=A0ABS7P6Z9_9NOCA|nr:hypothetical protein [Rhodococcus corynebacterioides]MBY6368207.1 hypothetical protein [Rhodococcus corynebacterioides]MBY6408889.1 hypothetical protein [Rhodococcus corynebacterioides]